jgi:cytidine deaminase
MIDQKLIQTAVKAHDRAYAPYSDYPVGAAVKDEHGHIFAGCNVENASYRGTCAEAGAVAAFIAGGGKSITEVVVVARAGIEPGMPCGGCRQIIREFAKPDCPIHICDEKGNYRKTMTLGELLPASFGPEHIFGNKNE